MKSFTKTLATAALAFGVVFGATDLANAEFVTNGTMTGNTAFQPPEPWFMVALTCDTTGYTFQEFLGYTDSWAFPPTTGDTFVSCIGDNKFFPYYQEEFGQTINGLTAGTDYELSFKVGNFQLLSGANTYSAPVTYQVFQNGSHIHTTASYNPSNAWNEERVTFTASESNTISFRIVRPAPGQQAYGSIDDVSIVISNSAPSVSGVPTSVAVVEDTPSNVDLSAATFADADGDNLEVTLTAGAGTFSAISGSGVTISGSGTSTLTLSGSASDINNFFDDISNIQYTTVANASGNSITTILVSASDGTTGLASNPSVLINSANVPDVTEVNSSSVNGFYKANEVISVQVNFDGPVTVSGTPHLTLETGITDRIATYSTGSGGTSLTFTYTAQIGDTTPDLDYTTTSALSLNGGSITGGGYAADLTLPSPGGAGSLAANKAIIIDTTAPTGYTVALDQDPINADNDDSISFTFASAEVGTTYTYEISSSGGGASVTGTGTIVTGTDQITGLDVSGLGDGTLTLSVKLTDPAGNEGSTAEDTAYKDTIAPTGHSASFIQRGVNAANETAIGFTITNAENVDLSYTISYTIASTGGGANVTGSGTISGGSGEVTGLDLSSLGDGTLTLTVVFTDEAGNPAEIVEDSVSKDVTIPDAPSVPTLTDGSNSGSKLDALTNDTTATITGTAEANATVTVYIGTSAVGTTSADVSGNWSFTFADGDLANGENSITATAADAVGNESSASGALVVVLDTGVPTVELTSNATNPQSGQFTVTVTFSELVTGFSVDDVTVGNGTVTNFVVASETVYTFDVMPTEDGAVTVDVAADVAQDAATNGNAAATQLSVATDGTAPTVTLTGPTEPVTEAFTLTITFSEDVTGFTAGDITIAGGTLGNFSGSGDTYTVVVTPVLGEIVTASVAANVVEDAAGNGNEASNTYTVQAGSPAAEFEANRRAIEDVLYGEMTRSVQSSLSSSTRMVRGARGRLIAAQGCGGFGDDTNDTSGADDETGGACNAGTLSNTVQPLDIDGVASVTATTLSTSGIITGETSYNYGQTRRMIFGDYDIQHDSDTGSTTATLSGRVTWEQIFQGNTLLGYFVGLEYADSQIDGTFEGDQTRIGLNFGGYAVQRVAEHLYADGYISMGLGDSDLDISNGTLDLQSNYGSQTITAGAALSGLYAYEQYEFRPELAINYGRTELGNVGFTGTAYGITDDTLSLDAGSVTVTNLTFRPEILFAVDGGTVAQSRTVMSFAPRLICEQTSSTLRADTDDCGGGAEIGFEAQSEDGLSSINFRIAVDEIGNTRRSTGNLGAELRF